MHRALLKTATLVVALNVLAPTAACGAREEPDQQTVGAQIDRGDSTQPYGGPSAGQDAGVDAGTSDAGAISFAVHVAPIFARSCTGYCHPGGYSPMSLEPQVAWSTLVNVPSSCPDRPRVAAAEPSAARSYLVAKLTGEQLCGGGIMPPGGTLPQQDIETIRAWIAQGAPNN